jgi:hypothetical protein
MICVVACFVSCPKFSLQDLCIKYGTVCMGTNVECLALNAWEHMWNGWQCEHGNICGLYGTKCMGPDVEWLAM